MKLFIAEDDKTSPKFLASLAGKWGYDVSTASDGEKALRILESPDAPLLILLDWMLPGVRGPDICARLREAETNGDCSRFMIMLTMRDSPEDIVEGLSAGANDYMVKPFHQNELRARLAVGRRILELQSELVEKVSELEHTLKEIRTLQGILPICMHCHKIRGDKEVWERLESYITDHTDALLSHSICPDCYDKHYKADAEGTED
ncbi:MAG: response regulator transcription factor [Planctomycetota bacterium]|nr:response regulator transcription factor [Planctomycetota bacterium]